MNTDTAPFIIISTTDGIEFYIRGSVHRNSKLIRSNKMQQYAGIYLLQNHSTRFGCLPHPSSGVHKTVIAASDTGHSICVTTFLQCGLAGHTGGRLFFSLRYRDMTSCALSWRIYKTVSSWDYLTFNAMLQWIWSELKTKTLTYNKKSTHFIAVIFMNLP
jgi:hypothetical protein